MRFFFFNFLRGNVLDVTTNPNLGSAFFETTWLQYLETLQATISVSLSLEVWCTRSSSSSVHKSLFILISMGRNNKIEHLEELLIQKDQAVRIQIHKYLHCESIFLFR